MTVIGAALVVGAAVPVAGATSISAAAPRGWRVVKSFGCADGGVEAVTSTGPRGAWATGYFTPCSPHASGRVLVARWDGRSWQQLPLPVGAPSSFGGVAVAALSNSYSWTFVDDGDGTFALLYRGGRWRTFQLPDTPFIGSAVAFSRSNAWAFGYSNVGGDPYAARFNGRDWRRVAIPVQPLATAAPAPGNIWAVGPLPRASHGGWALEHWTGRWQVVPLPAPPPGERISGHGVAWDNAHGAWVVAALVPTAASGGSPDWLLMHWTGSRWIDIRYPYPTFGIGLVHDGHGGLWIASETCRSCTYTKMVDYSPARGWSKPVPAGTVALRTMRLIPGTTSVWAGGTMYPSVHSSGGRAVILKFGP